MDTGDDETNDDSNEIFVYTGQLQDEIPKNITHVSIHASVKKIKQGAFQRLDPQDGQNDW